MASWQIAIACACAAPGVLLGLFLILRRQRVVGSLLVAVGAMKNSALAHPPSGKLAANAAWLVLAVMAFNLTRAAATLSGPALAKATTATIRRTLIHLPARAAERARRLILHLPQGWPWQDAWQQLQSSASAPPQPAAT